jgi:hypothetical protein
MGDAKPSAARAPCDAPRPAMESSPVGGDFYDVWPVGDSWMVIIGDASEPAIAQMAEVRQTVRPTDGSGVNKDDQTS